MEAMCNSYGGYKFRHLNKAKPALWHFHEAVIARRRRGDRRTAQASDALRNETAGGHDRQMSAGGYESWFISARDPVSPRALWIRHTRHRPRVGPESVALWCTVIDRDGGQERNAVKGVLAAFPPGTAAGPGQFRGQAAMAGHHARWGLAVTGEQEPLRPLRPAALYRAPLPRTKLEAVVPGGQVTGSLEVDGRTVAVS